MRKSKKRNPKIFRFAMRLLVCSFILFLVSTIFLNSQEININAQSKKVQEEMTTLKTDIDGLKIQKQKLSSFSRVKEIAEKKGYTYQQSSVSANVVGVDEHK
ncbi:hypothetical protein [Sharpea azabuensis]|uniref:Cell division protein FtsL n=3 Tax=Sharpea azabuensis TaxID=322505 RepID=A0A1H6R6Q1_9FIRM|nr:hypothetical protein [Sharpea azabuensis]MEE3308590.1 hypothetical protein [Sharpea azabuensis]SEI51413.1 cell division protein FtsL [Sharpea azabuensis]SFD50876.1 cell division protein FtsL [Sharpea azabuensis]SFK52286.1 cell division protein FtsL [Sharpea azabuensis]